MQNKDKDWLTIKPTDPAYDACVFQLLNTDARCTARVPQGGGRYRCYYDHPAFGEYIVNTDGEENDEVTFEVAPSIVAKVTQAEANDDAYIADVTKKYEEYRAARAAALEEQAQAVGEEHRRLVHPDGGPCPDGCGGDS